MPLRFRFQLANIFPSCFCWVFPVEEPAVDGFVPRLAFVDGAKSFVTEGPAVCGVIPVVGTVIERFGPATAVTSCDRTFGSGFFVGGFAVVRPCATALGFRFTGFTAPLPVLATVTFLVGECEPIDFFRASAFGCFWNLTGAALCVASSRSFAFV